MTDEATEEPGVRQKVEKKFRAVIFDFGGVLLRTIDWSGRRAWEQRLGLAPGESEEIVFGREMGTKAQLGQISDEELWQWVGWFLKLSTNQLERFRSDFWAGDRLDTELVDHIRRLRPRYQTAIISNSTDALRRSLNESYPIADAFDLIVCSAEEHVMKPDSKIYERTLQRLKRKAVEAVFIDDSQPNVRAASALGMTTLHFTAGMNVRDELDRLGVRPGGDDEQAN
jgi:epoxide hydrolase-like predicted phosphatase